MDWFWPNRRNRSQSPQASSAGIKTTTLVKQAKISYGFIMIKHCSTKCTGKNSLLCSARCCITNERRSFLIVVSESAAFTQNSSSQSPQFVLFPPALLPLLFHEQDFRPTPTCSIKVVVSVRVSKPNISESLSCPSCQLFFSCLMVWFEAAASATRTSCHMWHLQPCLYVLTLEVLRLRWRVYSAKLFALAVFPAIIKLCLL